MYIVHVYRKIRKEWARTAAIYSTVIFRYYTNDLYNLEGEPERNGQK